MNTTRSSVTEFRKRLRGMLPAVLVDNLRLARLYRRTAAGASGPAQAAAAAAYQQLRLAGSTPPLRDVGFQVYSGSDEDGILVYLFAVIGIQNRLFVDIGAAGIEGSNTANLIVNHGWTGLHVDRTWDALRFAQTFYRSSLRSRIHPPTPVAAAVTTATVNSIISENGLAGSIDLLSIDIDSNDYWVWAAIECVSPRVVVMEFQPALGPDLAVTIPYNTAFNRADYPINRPPFDIVYCGASLRALVQLGIRKGYRFVGCDSLGTNAFFVAESVAGNLPVAQIEDCFGHPRVRRLIATYFKELKTMEWEHV